VDNDGAASRRHYWWLAYEWNNLFLACGECSSSQGPKFPVDQQRVPTGTTGSRLERERPYLLDPCADDPEQHLVYLRSGEVVSEDPRGRQTIEIFDLNRSSLVSLRQRSYAATAQALKDAAVALDEGQSTNFTAALQGLYEKEQPFAAVRRQFANQWAQFRHRKIDSAMAHATDFQVQLSDLAGDLDRITGRVMYRTAARMFGWPERVETIPEAPLYQEPRPVAIGTDPFAGRHAVAQIELRNFKALRHLKLDLESAPGSWTVILGENGVGKSSVLQAIALCLVGEDTRETLRLSPAVALS
jgi:uncharacterized protein (TIGR02646 family)